ncbi:IclR family transcriptional regulator [Haloactinomyces albus]|uniref:DNA-binding IclR family transcriptional regulator n=1 Tax=Haloactinomyces albus TaxID=1352928 RepID=A0AAE3ZH48_9ACTN|nr:helix-turn-helix domain-containing protein [Haloactinomyces albus]MDR7303650.1 DNA-binding IclR family transcriptional regulator [Haloactinomyces albus]
MSTLQTLDRGLRTLNFVSLQPSGVLVSEIAEELGVHRAIAYRIVGTLEGHGLVARDEGGRVRLGAAVATLSRRFAPQLMTAGRPALKELADRTQATSFVSVAEGDECVVVMVEEARGQALRVYYQEGARHPLHRGAPGLAILATRPESPHDSEDVRTARERGYSLTHGQLQTGATGVSVGLAGIPALEAAGIEASVGVVVLGGLDTERAVRESRAAAVRLGALLTG